MSSLFYANLKKGVSFASFLFKRKEAKAIGELTLIALAFCLNI